MLKTHLFAWMYTTLDESFVIHRALPPVCMKYTARDESRVASIAQGEAEC